MHVVNLVFGGIVGAVLLPFRGLSPWVGLAAVSLLTALLMLEVYKLTSEPGGHPPGQGPHQGPPAGDAPLQGQHARHARGPGGRPQGQPDLSWARTSSPWPS
ncbi:MAG: hypothetical protein M0C28_27945 [Candidatus Moduliflexus flocculans]|nr:hypothetical protein [Candidatus Moduliflexus flocculans]